jgi:hypothetical protein
MPVVWDLETFPNCFLCGALGLESDNAYIWEISDRRDDRADLLAWLRHLAAEQIEQIGFNNIGFDYPIIHFLLQHPDATPADLYQKAQAIITSGDRWAHTIWPSDRFIPQIDLYKIHHFDNVARATSLKALEFNMRSPSVEDLPFPHGTYLTSDQIDTLRSYNMNDLTETKRFAGHSAQQIEFRRYLSQTYGRDFMNHNDTKIGKDYFVMKLEQQAPGSCYRNDGSGRQPVQTYRDRIALGDVILPYITFRHPEFQRVHAWLLQQVITDTRGVFTDVSCEIGGFRFDFGTGGIHGSVTRRTVRSDDDHALIDIDVKSYYPNIAIVNRLHPAHLGELFCDVYSDVYQQRLHYASGTPENKMLKLALLGVYGDSNNIYSPFYDPQYTMAITINGQLLLCMLAERLMTTVPGLEMIQINTDGLTVRVPRRLEWLINDACQWWQKVTGLALEEARYSLMHIRDVNSYLAVREDGKVKRIGAYETAQPGERTPIGWHQDCSALIVPKAAERYIVEGEPVEDFIKCSPGRDDETSFDFMCRAKANRGSTLVHGDATVQSTTRYYVSTDGAPLTKVSPPPAGCRVGHYKKANGVSDRVYHATDNTVWNPDVHTKNRSTHKERRTSICAGYLTTVCNRASDFRWENVNYDWYVTEARKLIE